MSSRANSDFIGIRLKLLNERSVLVGLERTSKATEKVEKSTHKATTKSAAATRVTSGLTRSYKELGSAARWGLGFLGVGGILAVESSIHATEELSKTTTGLSRNLGLSTNVASRWGAVAQAREIDSKALSMAFTTLSRRMVEAGRKGGTLLTPFHQLGISQEELIDHGHNFQWAIMRVTQALGDLKGGTVRQAAAQAVLGKGVSTILPLMSEGTEGLKEQLHWADEYGVTLNGHTNEAIMEMVQAQRENKVAMLGLQISLTKALMPAIQMGDEQLQEFIKTLNSPDLTAEQKISRISHQFMRLEPEVIHIVEQALPHIAEQGGHLGIALAGAIWHSFVHSDSLGRLAIGFWLFKSMGGFSLIGTLGAKVGGKLATSLGWKFLATVAPYFAAEAGVEGLGAALGSQMGGLKTLFGRYGRELGTVMGAAAAAAIVAEVVFAIEDSENIAGLSLVNTPELDAASSEEEAMKLNEQGYSNVSIESGHDISATSPSGKKVHFHQGAGGKWVKGGGGGSHGTHRHPHPQHHRQGARPREATAAPRLLPTGGAGRQIVIQHKIVLPNGQVLAEEVTKHALDEAALR